LPKIADPSLKRKIYFILHIFKYITPVLERKIKLAFIASFAQNPYPVVLLRDQKKVQQEKLG